MVMPVSPEHRRVRVATGPKTPSKTEREEHDATHLPHANWCSHCVRGRSREDSHK